jgi:hypothetical protein
MVESWKLRASSEADDLALRYRHSPFEIQQDDII